MENHSTKKGGTKEPAADFPLFPITSPKIVQKITKPQFTVGKSHGIMGSHGENRMGFAAQFPVLWLSLLLMQHIYRR